VHCPRCGTPNESGDRYCAACGEALGRSDKLQKQQSSKERLSRLLGSDRKSRLISAGTLLALAIAVAAFIAISPSGEGSIPRDRYTLAAERICLHSKRLIVVAGQEGGTSYARQLVPIVVRWREELDALRAPADRREQVQQLNDALREVEIEVATLARISEEGDRTRTLASAKRADIATAEVEKAIADLGLSECARATIGFKPGK
jgi:zinc-ribbon domain